MDRIFCVFACIVIALTLSPVQSRSNKCVKLTEPMCTDLSYNMTLMPNLLNHQTHAEASLELQMYQPFIEAECSEHLRMFLCYAHLPVCSILPDAIPPCRHLCTRAHQDCDYLMRRWGFAWPTAMSCDRFPISGLCVGDGESSIATSPDPPTTSPPPETTEGPKTRKPKDPKRGNKQLMKENLVLDNERLKIAIQTLNTEKQKLQLEMQYLHLKIDHLRQNTASEV